jgi:hypothetical protein
MDSNHADNDPASTQLLSANLSPLSYFSCVPDHDNWQQADVNQA